MTMKAYRSIAAGLLALLSVSVLRSALAEEPARLGELIVRTPELPSRGTTLSSETASGTRTLNVGEMVTSVPGVSAVFRGADAAEPVIRGLGWERVATRMGCLPLYGACPARMDPPATYVSPEALESIQVVKGVPSVTLGPGGTGGRLVLLPYYARGEEAPTEAEASGGARVTWDEGRDGYSSSVYGEAVTPEVDVRVEGNAANLNDYTSGDGDKVPANLEEYGGSLSLGWRPTEGVRFYGSSLVKEERNVDYPTLPMDIDDSTAYMGILGATLQGGGDALEGAEVEFGYSHIDHNMSNKNKPNRGMLHAKTPSKAKSYAGKVGTDWRLTEQALLTVGTDLERLERDATRRRTIMATGKTFHDHIWPDAKRDLVGGFGELNLDVSDMVAVRFGGRVDYAHSKARAADDKVVLGAGSPPSTIRDQYVRFYGQGADDVDNDDVLFSGNVLAEWQVDEGLLFYAGAGKVSRYPNVTEQYFAFAPAPGGYQVGDPSLDPEDKYEVNLGTQMKSERVVADLSLFAARVEDYIYQTRIARFDVNGDGSDDNIRGFKNVDAELYGGEAAATWLLVDGLTMPMSLAYVRARNTSDHRDLPEIPPLTGTAALRYDADLARPWWCEFGLRFAMRQDQIDETFPEDETASYEVFHLRGGCQVTGNLRLEVGVENLFDQQYHDHLTPQTVMAAGDLAAGDEVPAPGRYFYITAEVQL